MVAPARLAELHPPEPDAETLAAEYALIDAALDDGRRRDALAAWDRTRRTYLTWANLARLRFQQDTTDQEAARIRAVADRLDPVAQGYDTAVKRRLLADPDRSGLERDFGVHPVRLWSADLDTYAPAIAGRLEEEQRLAARYTAITAGAKIPFQGQVHNLSGLTPYAESRDRDIRHRAAAARWSFFADHADEIDGVFDDLVGLRDGMARALGDRDSRALGFRRMRRIGYGPEDVARYRDEIALHIVPLVARMKERQRVENGLDRLYAWDMPLIDPLGNPRPIGTTSDLLDASQTLFDRLDPAVGGLHRVMRDGGYLDVEARPNKAPGGQSEPLPMQSIPWVFANFNGTHGDISVHVHEMGHAFQAHASFGKPCWDAEYPTMETAEIHSMALELFAAPDAALLVGGKAADRFRRLQLIQFMDLLPRCALGDHFQHEIYANPGLTPASRHALWRDLERHYMPWLDWGDLHHPAQGGAWHATLHFFLLPFYYIDYALAACCALQFWSRARDDRASALADYLALCRRGNEAPFAELVRSAGLVSPFEPGSLAKAAAEVEREVLG